MLRQIRYLYEAEVKHLNPRRVQKALKQMQNQDMGQGISLSRRVQEVCVGVGVCGVGCVWVCVGVGV